MGNNSLNRAKELKKDEFYTLYEEIEEELKHYKGHFKGKKVFINCDDPKKSQFWQFFKDNFDNYGLKKLTAMYYQPEGRVYRYEMFGGRDDKGILRYTQTPIEGNGSYDSEESLGVLGESDIVVTNPPFSEWIPYYKLLREYKKDFIILGRQTALGYRDVFPDLRYGKVWTGVKANKVMEFKVPKGYQYEGGVELTKVSSISWYTNMEHPYMHQEKVLTEDYVVSKYDKYDNYPAINVNRMKSIPKGYGGVMGVPLTIMNHFDPSQFEIVDFRYGEDGKGLRVGGKEKFTRVLIRNKKVNE